MRVLERVKASAVPRPVGRHTLVARLVLARCLKLDHSGPVLEGDGATWCADNVACS